MLNEDFAVNCKYKQLTYLHTWCGTNKSLWLPAFISHCMCVSMHVCAPATAQSKWLSVCICLCSVVCVPGIISVNVCV